MAVFAPSFEDCLAASMGLINHPAQGSQGSNLELDMHVFVQHHWRKMTFLLIEAAGTYPYLSKSAPPAS
jgi:hypothetical protein